MRKMLFSNLVWVAFIIGGFISSSNIIYAQEESEYSIRMAKMMAEWMDTIWNNEPEEGLTNIKILMTKDGEPFAGKVSIMGEFSFRAVSEYTHTTGFNPNSNGRWVYEALESYIQLSINRYILHTLIANSWYLGCNQIQSKYKEIQNLLVRF